MVAKLQPCLWFDKNGEEAARFYADTFPGSRIDHVMRAPGDYPSGKQGDVLTIEMHIFDMPFLLLNGGPQFKFNEAVSFQVHCETQEEIDYFWSRLAEGGEEGPCGWLKDKFGLSWQIVPTVLGELASGPKGGQVMGAMMKMIKIDIAGLKAAAL